MLCSVFVDNNNNNNNNKHTLLTEFSKKSQKLMDADRIFSLIIFQHIQSKDHYKIPFRNSQSSQLPTIIIIVGSCELWLLL